MRFWECLRLIYTAITTAWFAFIAGAMWANPDKLTPKLPPNIPENAIIDVWGGPYLLTFILTLTAAYAVAPIIAHLIEHFTERKRHLTSEITYHPKFAQRRRENHEGRN